MAEQILRILQVQKKLNMSNTTFWRLRNAGLFISPDYIPGSNIKVWKESEVDKWIEQHIGSNSIEGEKRNGV